MKVRGPRHALPLAAGAATGALLSGAGALGTTALVLHLAGRLGTAAVPAFAAGSGVVSAVTLLAAAGGHRVSRGIRALRAEALARLREPGAPVPSGAPPRGSGRGSVELVELARTLEALHLRVRVADEVAERHRRTAESSSAGMFELLSGLVAAEEGARGQLAAELHDTVAQSLMLARSLLAAEPAEPGERERAGELVAEAEEQVRAVMARTRPPALREGDLARAVRGLRDDLAARYGLVVDVRWPAAAVPLPLVTAVTVYRFFQEALLNVVKHADVDEATATLRIDDDGLEAVVHDAGPGFDPGEVHAEGGRHVGLGLLRERARLAGGSLRVESWPTDGTTLTLRLPRSTAMPGPVAASA